jgi:hypothetical protein
MANINKKNVLDQKTFAGTPYGNHTSLEYHFETNSSGVFVDSDTTTAVVSGSVVRLGVIPAGFRMQDALVIISDAGSASVTTDVGFLYVDGVDVSAAAQDAAYFKSALATDATGVSRKTGVKAPITLTKDAYLTLTVGGANHASVCVMDIIVEGIWTGSSLT